MYQVVCSMQKVSNNYSLPDKSYRAIWLNVSRSVHVSLISCRYKAAESDATPKNGQSSQLFELSGRSSADHFIWRKGLE